MTQGCNTGGSKTWLTGIICIILIILQVDEILPPFSLSLPSFYLSTMFSSPAHAHTHIPQGTHRATALCHQRVRNMQLFLRCHFLHPTSYHLLSAPVPPEAPSCFCSPAKDASRPFLEPVSFASLHYTYVQHGISLSVFDTDGHLALLSKRDRVAWQLRHCMTHANYER